MSHPLAIVSQCCMPGRVSPCCVQSVITSTSFTCSASWIQAPTVQSRGRSQMQEIDLHVA